MEKFIAVFGSHHGRIISVGAEDFSEAREEILEQLSKPGRLEIRRRWQEDGEMILRDSDGELSTAEERIAEEYNYETPFEAYKPMPMGECHRVVLASKED